MRASTLRLHRAVALPAALYETGVLATAVLAAVTHHTIYWLALVAATLVCGLPAFVGVYVTYGLLRSIGAALGAHMPSSGYGPLWLVIPAGVIDTVLFGAAGLANILIVERVLHRRRDRHHSSGLDGR
jgi:hypothetical protein